MTAPTQALTAGPFHVSDDNNGMTIWNDDNLPIVEMWLNGSGEQVMTMRAQIACDALNVHHETGLTPGQLHHGLQAVERANDGLKAERDRLAERCAGLEKALGGVEGRIEYAAKAINDATRWDDEEAIDGEGSLFDWVVRDARAALEVANAKEKEPSLALSTASSGGGAPTGDST